MAIPDHDFPDMNHVEAYRALDILIPVAKSDTHQSRICADFILAWWNGFDQGKFNIIEVASVDRELGMAMAKIVLHLAQYGTHYPTGRRKEIEDIIDAWR